MSYNYINQAANIAVSDTCAYDSSVGYDADFSVNGDVSGWNYYNGIHTYGCWNGFLFGTFYGSSGYIARQNVFSAVQASQVSPIVSLLPEVALVSFGVEKDPEGQRGLRRYATD